MVYEVNETPTMLSVLQLFTGQKYWVVVSGFITLPAIIAKYGVQIG